MTTLAVQIRLTDLRGAADPHTNTNFTPRRFETRQEWSGHRETLRQQILASAGLWPTPPRRRVRSQSFGRIERGGVVIERLLVETLPGFHVGVNVYRPAQMNGRAPGVLVPHGHWKHGRVENSEVYSVPALGEALAANGYLALAYDMVGYNDTRQVPHKFGDSEEESLWSFGPLALQLWNSLRMTDYLVARPEVDAARIAVTGASGGGTQSYLLAAVDDRIRLSIPAVMVSARFQGDDPCEMAPGLRVHTNNVEIAAAAAPRPMLLLSSAKDWTSQTPELEFPAIREVYGLLGSADQVENYHVDSEHGYNAAQRKAALEFLSKHFGLPAKTPPAQPFTGPDEELLVGQRAAKKSGAIDEAGVFGRWKKLMNLRNRNVSAGQKIQLLRRITGGFWPGRVQLVGTGGDGFLHRDGGDDALPVHVQDGRLASAVVAVHPKGIASARNFAGVRTAAEAGERVLLIDAFGTGAAAEPSRARHSDYLVYHYAEDANRVQDILTAAAWLDGQGAKSIRLICGAGAEAWCRLAAAIAPRELRVEVESPRHYKLSIPGLKAAGYRADL